MPRVPYAEPSPLGSVVSYCPVASSVGARVLREGGNAADAAVATALALAVTYPQAGNLGGGGFLMYAEGSTGEVHFLDYRETAPLRVRPEPFLAPDGTRSPASVLGATPVGVPGTIAGMAELLRRFGSFSWDRLVSLTIDLAEVGFWLTSRQAEYMNRYRDGLSQFESTRRCFSPASGAFFPGTLFRQPELGRALRVLAESGPQDFYTGTIARLIADEIARYGGVLDLEDLAAYRPKWRTPLKSRFGGRDIYTAPPPSGGGMVLHLSLGLLESIGIDAFPPANPKRYVWLARAFRAAFAVRHEIAGDPEFLSDDANADLNRLLTHGMTLEQLLHLEDRFRKVRYDPAKESQGTQTTHFSVVDPLGNAVSNTYSLNTLFGSKLVVSGCGFLLNNSLDDFRIADAPNWYGLVDGARNQMVPGSRPVGSMSPTIAVGPSGLELVLGSSGGPMIPTTVAQALLGVLVDGRSLSDAVSMPRVHHQYIRAETQVEEAIGPDAIRALESLGDPVVPSKRMGICAGIQRDPTTEQNAGVLDPRFGQYRLFV